MGKGEGGILEELVMSAIQRCENTRCRKCSYYRHHHADNYTGKCRARMIADHLRENGVSEGQERGNAK